MKRRRESLLRVRRRAGSSGFTLMELMIVVMLVAILATLAAPTFIVARNDRLAFDYARQYQEQIAKARARAMGRGAAHLVLFAAGGGQGRGWVRVYEALDGAAVPNPVSSCKRTNQWAQAQTSPTALPTINGNMARFVDWVELNNVGVNDTMNIMTYRAINRPQGEAWPVFTQTPVIAMCFTPSGTTFAAGGVDPATAIANMQSSPAFNDVVELVVSRRDGTGAAVGVRRRVIVAGSTGPRLKSE